jgi:hypothetical protein
MAASAARAGSSCLPETFQLSCRCAGSGHDESITLCGQMQDACSHTPCCECHQARNACSWRSCSTPGRLLMQLSALLQGFTRLLVCLPASLIPSLHSCASSMTSVGSVTFTSAPDVTER